MLPSGNRFHTFVFNSTRLNYAYVNNYARRLWRKQGQEFPLGLRDMRHSLGTKPLAISIQYNRQFGDSTVPSPAALSPRKSATNALGSLSSSNRAFHKSTGLSLYDGVAAPA